MDVNNCDEFCQWLLKHTSLLWIINKDISIIKKYFFDYILINPLY